MRSKFMMSAALAGMLAMGGCLETPSETQPEATVPEVTMTERVAAEQAASAFSAALVTECGSLYQVLNTEEGQFHMQVCIDEVVEQYGNYWLMDEAGKQAAKERLVNAIIRPHQP